MTSQQKANRLGRGYLTQTATSAMIALARIVTWLKVALMTKRKSYSKNVIVEHWLDDGRFQIVMTDVCWICGTWTVHTEKCHIEPLCRGGKDELDNIVLLCRNCHKYTEGLTVDQFWFYVEAYPQDLIGHMFARAYAAGEIPAGSYRLYKQYTEENPTHLFINDNPTP